MKWSQATRIDWGTILLFGGGIALGKLAFDTGLANSLGKSILGGTGVSGNGMITLLAIIIGIVISETTSNTASATMVIPVAISVARAAGVNPLAPALGACLGSSFGFMLPVSTPPNAIVYGTGFVPIVKMVKTGIIFDIIGAGVIWVTVMVGAQYLK
jgi:sodium-dependent dicarboxylate transporter 2/3/5